MPAPMMSEHFQYKLDNRVPLNNLQQQGERFRPQLYCWVKEPLETCNKSVSVVPNNSFSTTENLDYKVFWSQITLYFQ